jgi:nucleoid-associated protein YgaU
MYRLKPMRLPWVPASIAQGTARPVARRYVARRRVSARAVNWGDSTQFHTVKIGDSLADIAAAYGVTVRELRAINSDLLGHNRARTSPLKRTRQTLSKENLIYPGDTLYLPLCASASRRVCSVAVGYVYVQAPARRGLA